MKIIEELQSLDTSDPGRWPLLFRIISVAVVFVAVSVLGVYMFVIKSEIPLLERSELEEQELRATFEERQTKAANFDAYRAQLAEIERSFGAMQRMKAAHLVLATHRQPDVGAGFGRRRQLGRFCVLWCSEPMAISL